VQASAASCAGPIVTRAGAIPWLDSLCHSTRILGTVTTGDDRLRTFSSAREFRAWLRAHHRSATELLVRCYKVTAKHRGLTYREAVDEALCFGWIDGVRRAADDQSFSTRFTPRKSKSTWSAVNIRRAKQLGAEGRMQPAGRAAFAAREARNSQRYSFESKPRKLAPKYQRKFRANDRAWSFFRAQAPWYQRTSIFWVMEAKREETRVRRLDELISSSARGQAIKLLARAQRR
jgi:uncharacterized protein YdeI (YjbR/CyaY-like superfamily)